MPSKYGPMQPANETLKLKRPNDTVLEPSDVKEAEKRKKMQMDQYKLMEDRNCDGCTTNLDRAKSCS